MRALIQRINRRLPDGEMLKTARSPRVASSVGRYYVANLNRNWITPQKVDPEAMGRELGVLSEYEHVEEDWEGPPRPPGGRRRAESVRGLPGCFPSASQRTSGEAATPGKAREIETSSGSAAVALVTED